MQEVKEQERDGLDEEEKYSTHEEVYSGDEHEKFEQLLYGTPEAVEVETEIHGIEIFVDYVQFFDDQQNLVTAITADHWNSKEEEL